MLPAKKVPSGAPASALIDEKIELLNDWRGKTLARVRKLIREAVPQVLEEWKWGIPVWSQGGIICTGETYKAAVKLTFPKGASLDDPSRLFNSSLEGNVRRAIDLREGEKVNAPALKALFRSAAAQNLAGKSKGKTSTKKAAAKPQTATKPRAANLKATSGVSATTKKGKSKAPAPGKTRKVPRK